MVHVNVHVGVIWSTDGTDGTHFYLNSGKTPILKSASYATSNTLFSFYKKPVYKKPRAQIMRFSIEKVS